MISRCEFLRLLKILAFLLGLGTIGFLCVSVGLSRLTPELPPSAVADQPPKLLPEERLRNLFTYDGIWLFPKNQCKCEAPKGQGGYNFQDAYGQSELPAVKARRRAEFEHFQRREGLARSPLLLAQPNLPFGYPVHGLEVMPLHTVPLPGLQFEGQDAPFYKVTLTASLGTLNTLADVPDSVVQGRGRKQLTVSTSNRQLLNFVLQHLTYTSTVYQHPSVDVVSLESKSSVARFPVTIRHPVMPRLYDPGPERKLRDLVTIATKTFLRPHKLMTMLRSIREFYPDLTVIVADDSKEPLKIKDDHVEYYTMPFGKATDKRRALEETMAFTTQALASVAYQVGNLAGHTLRMLDLQAASLRQVEARVNTLGQMVSMHMEKVARREIGTLATVQRLPPGQKVIAPDSLPPLTPYYRRPLNFGCLDDIGHGIKDLSTQLSRTGTLSRKSIKAPATPASATLGRPPRIPEPVQLPVVPDGKLSTASSASSLASAGSAEGVGGVSATKGQAAPPPPPLPNPVAPPPPPATTEVFLPPPPLEEVSLPLLAPELPLDLPPPPPLDVHELGLPHLPPPGFGPEEPSWVPAAYLEKGHRHLHHTPLLRWLV
ncbi:PREDICTED: beta-1%2C4 [Lynx pardinus]|uniref:PREDICTED: beta-1,4 n=1 Tax=Lynx pardinus TaxID=191816 RepID=A0A485PNQ0_LYNPA|nr:PREDICTED: beta-1%2C4 [Lynx pardinus]